MIATRGTIDDDLRSRAASGPALAPTACALAAFALSGFSALVYQVVWQRVLGLFSGVHNWSITVIVTAYMLGLGFGSLAGGRVADRLSRRAAIRAFALCELAVAAFGALSPWLYYDVAYAHLGGLVRHPAALPLVHLTLLILPTSLMGASLPLLARAVTPPATAVAAQRIAWLYAANTLGAACGAFATAWWIAGAVGFVGAVRLAAGFNVAAAFLVLVISPRTEPAVAPHVPLPASAVGASGARAWAVLYALSGFIALGLEMVWLRVLGTTIKANPRAFGHLLGVLLVTLACGGWVGARHIARRPHVDAWGMFLRLQWAVTITAAIPMIVLPLLVAQHGPLAFFFEYLTSDSALDLARIAAAASAHDTRVLRLATCLWILVPLAVMAPATLLMGVSYAWIQRAVQTDPTRVGRQAGLIQGANVLGCALGSALTGGLLFDLLGTALSLRLLVASGTVFGWLWVRWDGAPMNSRRLVPAVLLPVVLAAMLPRGDRLWACLHGTDPASAVFAEDASSVVSMQPRAGTEAVMRINGIGHSILPYWNVWALLGILPGLVHGDAKHALIIGMGTGTTPWAASKLPGIERIDLYEIARPEREALTRWEARGRRHPEVSEFLESPLIRTRFMDGRLALRLEPTRYDFIEADALEPDMAYSGNLYSLDFFLEARRRLAPGGVFCSYVPGVRVAETFKAAFPFVLDVRAQDIRIMLGSETPLALDRERLLQSLSAPALRDAFGTTRRGTEILSELVVFTSTLTATPLGPETARSTDDINTDLFPRDEFASAPAS